MNKKAKKTGKNKPDFIETMNRAHRKLVPVIGNIAMMSAQLDETISHHLSIAINPFNPSIGSTIFQGYSISAKFELYLKIIQILIPADNLLAEQIKSIRALFTSANKGRNRAIHSDWAYDDLNDCYHRITDTAKDDTITLAELNKIVDDHQSVINSIYSITKQHPLLASKGPFLERLINKGVCD